MRAPGPPGPAVLQTLAFTYRPFELFEWCARRYGDPFTMRMAGFGEFVMVSAPELIKQVFTGDPADLPAGKANAMLEPMVGAHSVLLLDGSEHLRQRRLLMGPLHGERMQTYAALMAEIASAELRRMPVGRRFALHPHMQTITLQVILRAIFGLDEGADRARRRRDEAVGGRGNEIDAQMDALAAKLVTLTTPPPSLMLFMPTELLLRYGDFPLSPFRAFLRRRDDVDRSLYEIIAARRQAADPSRTDMLSMLLCARDEDGRAMSDRELRDELITMLLAGHETTATALSWACAFVLSRPDVRERLLAELAPTGGDPVALTSCVYLDAVIREALRLRPIVPDVVRRVERPMVVGDCEVPVGAFLTPNIYLAHRRAESWPEPEQFRPERFLGAKIDPYAWLPFGGGIRRCLGMAFALYEMKIVLGATLLSTSLQLDTDAPLEPMRRGVTLAPRGGLPVIRPASS